MLVAGEELIADLVRPIVSLMTCDLGLILELAGGFSATALAYLFRERPDSFSLTWLKLTLSLGAVA